jgi:hypothetical protein
MSASFELFALDLLYNPLGLTPGVLIPLFRRSVAGQNEMFVQCVDGGRISSFNGAGRLEPAFIRRIDNRSGAIIKGVGDEVVYGYCLGANDWRVFLSLLDLQATLSQSMSDGFFAGRPFAGVEVARFLRDEKAECEFAEEATAALVAVHRSSAKSWVRHGCLSDRARRSARRKLSELLKQGVQRHHTSQRLTIALSEASKVLDVELGAHQVVGLDSKKPDLVVFHTSDLYNLTYNPNLFSWVKEISQRGTRVVLFSETAFTRDLFGSAQDLAHDKIYGNESDERLGDRFLKIVEAHSRRLAAQAAAHRARPPLE